MVMSTTFSPITTGNAKASHARLLDFGEERLFNPKSLRPAELNDRVYRPVTEDDPEVQALADDIRENGLIEPILITTDFVVVSGHRRRVASILAGFTAVPCRKIQIASTDPLFARLLVSCNRQRTKTFDEVLREEVMRLNPAEEYEQLLEFRRAKARVPEQTVALRAERPRKRISRLKREMADAVVDVVRERRDFWPLSVRAIHYALLNSPPRRNANRDDRYANNLKCYSDLTDLAARLRLIGEIPFNAINDETRPFSLLNVHKSPQSFVRHEFDNLLKGYYRDLQQSQPNHVEVLVEKNTVVPILQPIAAEFCCPMTSGRGYCSLEPRYQMSERFRASGRERLVVVVCSDHDPEGEDIPESFGRSMRDDFGIENVHVVKAALRHDQVQSMDLPSDCSAKPKSSRYNRFTTMYGDRTYELEALPPRQLQQLLRESLDSVIDIESLNSEIEREIADAAWLTGVRRKTHEFLQQLKTEEE